jgi:peptidoglycan-associated lipoprotein
MKRNAMARGAVAAAALLVFGLLGCQTTSTSEEAQASAPTGSEFDQGTLPADEARYRTASLETVYFDFDRYDIRPDAAPVLRGNAENIKRNSGWGTVTIEGHCDDRGSAEYNLALGERRANTVKQYLVDLGVPAPRLRTVSYGETKPEVKGFGEEAWSVNRRSDFKARVD